MIDNCKIGYCTNVHAGATLEQVKSNLKEFAIPVKNSFRPNTDMGIGLWLTNQAATELLASNRVEEFADWLRQSGLDPFTFNAFPFSNFHQPVVKHKVYQPTWAEPDRLQYTIDIAKIQSRLLDENQLGTISTLPLGWPIDNSADFLNSCATHLLSCAEQLACLEEQTGRHIFLCIEPEPGCVFDISHHIVQFFEQYLEPQTKGKNERDRLRRYIGVCHDVCHAAVMNEPQQNAIKTYMDHEIRIGKFQISSAIETVFDDKSPTQKNELLSELQNFAEDRYLHQTVIVDDGHQSFYEDLPLALSEFSNDPRGVWTVHFHVPIFAHEIGKLGTTQDQIASLLEVLPTVSGQPYHFEIETYAWTVLPDSLMPDSLQGVISKELKYFEQLLDKKLNVPGEFA